MAIVFQYGSNCLEREINSPKRLDNNAKFLDVANYEFTFDVYAKAKNRQCGASDIVKLKRLEESEVWGVLWDVPDYMIPRGTAKVKGVNSLDAIEGEGINYRRRRILVQRPNSKKLMPFTYVVIHPISQGVETSKEYAKLIIDGLKEHMADISFHVPHPVAGERLCVISKV